MYNSNYSLKIVCLVYLKMNKFFKNPSRVNSHPKAENHLKLKEKYKPSFDNSFDETQVNYTNHRPNFMPPYNETANSNAILINKEEKSSELTNDKKQNGLKMITVSSNRIYNWENQKDEQVIYIVYGYLDTYVNGDGECLIKQFNIKDRNGTLQCIFYEIDRMWPKLTRGQTVRCVGRWLPAINRLQCFSIRVATKKEMENARDEILRCLKLIEN